MKQGFGQVTAQTSGIGTGSMSATPSGNNDRQRAREWKE
jgi:hypothetical protein